MRRAAHRSRLQAATGFSSSEAGPRLRSGQAKYLMELAIGTLPVPFITLFDTGSDLTWTQCQPCKLCFPQDTPVPTASSSFSPLTCSSDACLPVWSRGCAPSSLCGYRYAYGDDSHSAGVLGTETLTFGSGPSQVPAPFAGAVAFGCGRDNGGDWYNSTGLVGLGRGSLSLVAQLGFEKFSYCLTDLYNTSLGSHVLFGSLAELAPPPCSRCRLCRARRVHHGTMSLSRAYRSATLACRSRTNPSSCTPTARVG
uniref:Peptidase A1 domain-containing protein n=1 Tax=Triticum urartu TaxID=4572 RepID=A0A8R7PQ52_TRIUA